jgi:HK97 family phage major capsid protein
VPHIDLAATHVTNQSPLFGGMKMFWVSEGGTETESEPSFGMTELVAKDHIGLLIASNQLVDDGGEPLGVYLEHFFSQLILWKVEQECLTGSGVGKPLGITNAPGTVAVTRAGAGHVAQADLATMIAALLPASFTRAIWACHPTVLGDLAKLAAFQINKERTPGDPLCGNIMGAPLYVTEKLSTLGTIGDIVLFDPQMYVLGTRDILIDKSRYSQTQFYQNQTAFRIIWRGDGQPLVRGTMTEPDNATTVGCYVQIAT